MSIRRPGGSSKDDRLNRVNRPCMIKKTTRQDDIVYGRTVFVYEIFIWFGNYIFLNSLFYFTKAMFGFIKMNECRLLNRIYFVFSTKLFSKLQ